MALFIIFDAVINQSCLRNELYQSTVKRFCQGHNEVEDVLSDLLLVIFVAPLLELGIQYNEMEIESVLPGLLENKLGANLLLFLVLLVILKFFLGEAQQVALELLVFLQLILDLIQVLFGVSLKLVVDHRLKLGLKGLGVILLPISVSLGLSLHFFVVFDQLVQVVFCFTFQFFLLALTQLFEHF